MLVSASRVVPIHIARARAIFIPAAFPPKSAASSSKRPVKSDPVDPILFNQLRQRIIERHTSSVEWAEQQLPLTNASIFAIRKGLAEGDVDSIRTAWTQLRRTGHLHVLAQEVVEQIAQLATADISRFRERGSHRTFVEDVALAAASYSTDAINACLVAYLKTGDPNSVLELYEKYKQLPDTLPPPTDSDLIHTTDDLDAVASETIPGRAYVTLAVVAAYAMQDSLPGALNEFLTPNMKRIQRHTLTEFLRTIPHDPTLQEKVDDYLQRIDLARTVARPVSFSKHIHNLATKPPNSPLLQDAYKSLIESMTRPDAHIAAKPTLISPTKPAATTELVWASFLAAFLKRDRKDLAAQLWNDMTQFGVRPGTFTWNMVLDVYSERGASRDVLATWETMTANGVKPDGYSYRALISALFAQNQFDQALRRFQIFRTDVQSTCTVEQTTAVYNAVLHGLLRTGRDNVTAALSLFQTMMEDGPPPNVVSYNTLINYYGRQNDLKGIVNLISQMAGAKVHGDVVTFSTVLSALLKLGRLNAPATVMSIMRSQGIQPSVVTYTSIIDAQMREKSIMHLKAALGLLHEMETDPDVGPNEVTYTSILAGLYRSDWLSPDEVEMYAQDVFAGMKKMRIQLTMGGYNILIKACLLSEQPTGLETALGYYREMRRRNILASKTYYVLLAGLSGRGQWQLAREIADEIPASGITPSPSLSRLVDKINRQQ